MLITLAHELKYYFKNKQEAIYLYSFILSVILLIPFSQNISSVEIQKLAPLTLWIALASSIALGGASLFRRDAESGQLEYLQLSKLSLEGYIFAKWLAFYLFILVPMLAILPLLGLLFQLSAQAIGHYGVGLLAGAAALSMLTALVGAITSGMEKAGAVLSLIMLPLAIPVMIFGANYCREIAAIWQPNLLFMLGFSGFILPILCIAGAYSIRASH